MIAPQEPRWQTENSLPGSWGEYSIEPCHTGELGPRIVNGGVHFGVYSKHARNIYLELFNENHADPIARLRLPSCQDGIFEGYVPGLAPGVFYGLIAEGPFDPKRGHRFNPHKLLLDPYAKALHGVFQNKEQVLKGHALIGGDDADLFPDHRLSHAFMPKCLLIQSKFDWEGVQPPKIPRQEWVIYEAHVRGFTAHPESGCEEPGTFRAFTEKIPYLKSLGINAVELLPIHAKYSEDFLLEKGLSNYWGYNTAAFFALEPSYGSRQRPGCEIDEFKFLVRELHRAGIEVILDVVYNHSAEGNEFGPTLSFRGLDNRSYYALHGSEEEPARRYWNHTGCGNTLDFGSPAVLRMVLDSLRYFVTEFHIDGFRFDLATVHGRMGGGEFDPAAPFFAAIGQDPLLRQVKLIAEPWDLGAYGLGRFPESWMEWNGRFRDTIRRWIRGEPGLLPALRNSLEGSPEAYASAGREPWSGINFITCHDGFTLHDLVSYNQKQNHANGESNRDGSDHNHSWNSGVEGHPVPADISDLRHRQMRNALLLTLLSRGTPMLLAGDEFLRTQIGNNNAYCQDNALSWVDWSQAALHQPLIRFVRELLVLRKLIHTRKIHNPDSERKWISHWREYDVAGRPISLPSHSRIAAFLFHQGLGTESDLPLNPELPGRYLHLILNTTEEATPFHLPHLPPPWKWVRVVDTAMPSPLDVVSMEEGVDLHEPYLYTVKNQSSVLLLSVRNQNSPDFI